MGLFITCEGIEGCGKTTQLELLGRALTRRGIACTLTREPGGTPAGEAIRRLFLHSASAELLPLTELLLITAARVQHVERVIRPALQAGRVVVCDRFCDATAAYQGYAGGIPLETIDGCHRLFLDGMAPDLTLLFDCPVEVGLGRSRARNRADGIEQTEGRFEAKDDAFHEKVRRGYLALARRFPGRFVVLDAGDTIDGLHGQVCRVVLPLMQERGYAV
jgi:dTMP kinase